MRQLSLQAGERRWRGETERSQCERARARACLLTGCARPVRRRSLEPALVHCRPHPIGSRTTRAAGAGARAAAPSPSPGPDPSQVRAAPADGRRTCGTTLGRGTRPALSLFWTPPCGEGPPPAGRRSGPHGRIRTLHGATDTYRGAGEHACIEGYGLRCSVRHEYR